MQSRTPDPRVRSAYRRQVWTQVFLPLALGIAIVVGALALNWTGITGAPDGLADATIALLLLPLLALGLLVLGLLVGLIWLIGWGMGKVPRPAAEVQMRLDQAARQARRASDLAASPLTTLQGLGAGAAALWKWFTSGSAADL
jgi:hypothetical protein